VSFHAHKLYTDAAENCSDLMLDEKGSYSRRLALFSTRNLHGTRK
jgi:hypothetical protein